MSHGREGGPLPEMADLSPVHHPQPREGPRHGARADSDGFQADPQITPELSELGFSLDDAPADRSSIQMQPPDAALVVIDLSAEQITAERELALRVGHRFHSPEHFAVALTHPSWRNERPEVRVDNQRYEFLGDLVVGLAIGHALFARLPNAGEGDLSALKSFLVREATLAEVARSLNVGSALRLGRGEDNSGGRQRPSVLADALEAIIAAVALDAGTDRAIGLVLRLFGQLLDEAVARYRSSRSTTELRASTASYKSALQQLLAARGCAPPDYAVVAELGPAEARRFRVEVRASVGGQWIAAVGEGSSKKAAEALAAERLYVKLPMLP